MCGLKVTQLCGRFPRAAKEPTKPLTAYNPFFPYRLRIFGVLLDISSMAPPSWDYVNIFSHDTASCNSWMHYFAMTGSQSFWNIIERLYVVGGHCHNLLWLKYTIVTSNRCGHLTLVAYTHRPLQESFAHYWVILSSRIVAASSRK